MAVKRSPKPDDALGQGKRRTVYGLNVAVAVVAALAVVVVLNALINLPAVRGVLPRLDLTAGRTQTLSGQTQRVLDGLEVPVTITAVTRTGTEAGRRSVALLDRYARHRPELSVAVIDPDRDLDALEAFYRGLDDRFADETAPLRAAVERGVASLQILTDDLAAVEDVFAGLGDRPELQEGTAGDRVQSARVAVGETRERYATLRDTLSAALTRPVPPLANLRIDLLQAFRQADDQVLAPYRTAFAQMARQRDAPMAVRDAMLKLDRPLTEARDRLAPAIDALSLPPDPNRYGRVQEALRAGEVLVVLSPDRERVLPVGELLLPDPTGDGTGTGLFVGEDRLTSALLTLGLEHAPRVIFARDRDQNVLAPRAGLSAAAARLRFADFDVSTWRIGGADAAANLLPAAAPGQTTVWVVPALSLDRTTAADRKHTADFLRRRLAAGDGVLLNRVYDADAAVREKNPLDTLAAEAGITPETHVLVLREAVSPDGRTQPTSAWAVDTYPEGAPLSAALAGRRLDFALPTPLTLSDPARPLLELNASGADPAWRAEGIQKAEDIRDAKPTDATRLTGPVPVAAYAPGPGDRGRLIVVGDGVWLGDAQLPARLGNGELFVNAVNWLAGLDEAIAATPRVHDVRRLDAFAPSRVTWVKLLLQAGLPAAALLAGVGVWWVRRRG